MEHRDSSEAWCEQMPNFESISHSLAVELVCQSFEKLEDLDIMLLNHLQEMGLSDVDIEDETEFSFTDAQGNLGSDINSVASATFPVVVRIVLRVRRKPSESVSVLFTLIDGRQFSVKMLRRASLQELKVAAEQASGIQFLEQELFLGSTKINEAKAPLLSEHSDVIEITLVRSRMGHAAELVKKLQATSSQDRQLAIEALLCSAGNGTMDPQLIASCLGEMESRSTAEPAFLRALQSCLGSMSHQTMPSDECHSFD